MGCDGLSLTSTVPTLRLESSAPELTLTATAPELSLASATCVVSFAVAAALSFAVTAPALDLVSSPIDVCLTTPVPVGTGEANDGANCGTGAGVYRDKQGATLRFRSLQSLSDGLTFAENDAECTVDADLDLTQVERWNVEPSGDKDGANLTYTLPEAVLAATLRLYRNGVRLREDTGGGSDFALSESGGAGTGYDRITITAPALVGWELLTADYVLTT